MNGQTWGVGVVGLGNVAGAHIKAFGQTRGAEVVAAVSRREQSDDELRGKYGTTFTVHHDLESMLADPAVDVVDICTPHFLHAEQAMAAARAGKHLVIEKPICLTLDQLRDLEHAVEQSGVRTCVCFECRFSEHFTCVRSLLDNDMLGQVHYGEVDYYHGIRGKTKHWHATREGAGSSLLTAGCHALDGLLYFMDSPVEEVTALNTRTANPDFSHYEYDTSTIVLLRFESGAVGKVASVIDCIMPYYLRVQLLGSRGTVIDDRFCTEAIDGLNKKRWTKLGTSTVHSGAVSDHPYLAQFQAFIDSLDAGREMPRTDLATAATSHRVCFAADLSAELGRPVKMGEVQ